MDSVFDDLYSKYHQDVFQFLFYMVKNRQQAEDLVQEVYIRVLKSYDRFEGKSSEKTWLFAIARNVAIDHFRKEKSWRQRLIDVFDITEQTIKDESYATPDEVTILNEEIKQLYDCLDQCTVDQRAVIIMRYIQQFSISETAESLGWTESKVKTTQHRAMNRLRTQMIEKDTKGGNRSEKIRVER